MKKFTLITILSIYIICGLSYTSYSYNNYKINKTDNENILNTDSCSNHCSKILKTATTIIAASTVVLISNDFTLGASISSIKKNGEFLSFRHGYNLGLRKTFNKSAFEYGINRFYYSYTDDFSYYNVDYSYDPNNINGSNNGTSETARFTEKSSAWYLYFSYLHNIFHTSTPEWLNIYIGPTVNYCSDLGYGAILGSNAKITDFLKFDLRMEYTSQTRFMQAGLIFTFQNKYFWEDWF